MSQILMWKAHILKKERKIEYNLTSYNYLLENPSLNYSECGSAPGPHTATARIPHMCSFIVYISHV